MSVKFHLDRLNDVSARVEFLNEFIGMVSRNNIVWSDTVINEFLKIWDETRSNFEGSLMRD